MNPEPILGCWCIVRENIRSLYDFLTRDPQQPALSFSNLHSFASHYIFRIDFCLSIRILLISKTLFDKNP